MKRTGVILTILALLLAAGGVCAALLGRSMHSLRQAQSEAHEMYEQLRTYAASFQLIATEGGKRMGSYSLEELGLLESTLLEIDARTSDFAKMEPADFEALSLAELYAWGQADRTVPSVIPFDAQALNTEPILRDLEAIPRIAPQNARAIFSSGAYLTHPERLGTMLDLNALSTALQSHIGTLCLQPGGPLDATLDIAALGCYMQPEVTTQNAQFDYTALLQEDTADLTISVQLLDHTEQLALSSFLQANASGKVLVDEAALTAQVQAWAQETNRQNTEYLLASCTGETVPISFLFCNYTLDEEALCATLLQQLPSLDCSPVTAHYLCTDASGAEFSPLGDTYVEVSIRAQRMAFYQNGVQLAVTDVVTGKTDGHQTPTGLYHVQSISPNCWLTGPDYKVFVKYWVGFYGAYGIHDASWRTLFGGTYYLYGGSHGCVNTPDDAMSIIFEHIELGIPVLVH